MVAPDPAHGLFMLAQHDLAALRAMHDPAVFAEEIFGFHAQQAVEKHVLARLR